MNQKIDNRKTTPPDPQSPAGSTPRPAGPITYLAPGEIVTPLHARAFLGIDPGKSGAWAVVFPDGSADAAPVPLAGNEIDAGRLAETFAAWDQNLNGRLLAVVEKVHAMPKQGVSSSFDFGKSFGIILGILGALKISYRLVTPEAWKKSVLAGLDWKGNKGAAVTYARRAFPDVSLVLPRCRVPHDGMADALCLAEHGRKGGA